MDTESVDNTNKPYLLKYQWEWLYKPRVAYSNQSEKDWLSDYQIIYKFNTIRQFWNMFNCIPEWNSLSCGSIYALFKKDIKPSWEDKFNDGGFSWIMYLSQRINDTQQQQIYTNIILMLIGNTYKYGLLLNGCTFEKKSRGDKIVFWFRKNNSDSKENIVVKPRTLLKELLTTSDIEDKEWAVLNNDDKIDWKGQQLRQKKIAIKLIQHNTTIKHKAVTTP